ncbi:MAG: putative manganese transporter [Acetatifactor sp.]
MMEALKEVLLETLTIVPFLFLAYLAMEYLEHKAGKKAEALVKRAGQFGPVFGGLLGVIPQCGFSAAASNLYAGRVITLGTLLAVYLSTSDEMLLIMISSDSEKATALKILGILALKVFIGILTGLVIDIVLRSRDKEEHEHIHSLCEHDHCHCEEGIVKSAIIHTLQITFFILVISAALELLFFYMGEDSLSGIVMNHPVLGPVLASLVGLIPNCAGSVALTELYLEGVIGIGSMLAGLLTGSGVGLLVLFRVNHHRKENFMILGLLYGIGVIVGILAELIL